MDNLIDMARAALSATPTRWTDLARHLPQELPGRAPLPGEWSAVQCLQHLIDGERFVFPVRLQAFLAGKDIADSTPRRRVQRRSPHRRNWLRTLRS